jgi:hypothetical protein
VLLQGLTLMTAGLPKDPTQMATIRFGPNYPTQAGARACAARAATSTSRPCASTGTGASSATATSRRSSSWARGDGYSIDGSAFTDAPGWTHIHLIEPATRRP